MRTVDELENALDDELSWRRTELQALKSQGRGASGPAERGLCRAGVAILYAHWEGYTKFALSAYLRFVARRRLRYGELQPCFVARGAEHEVARQGLSDSRLATARIEWVIRCGESRSRFSGKEEVDTRSNLNSEVWNELVVGLGLDGTVLDTKEHLIDYSLLRVRNEIAHGRFLEVDWAAYSELHDEVLGMLATVRKLVIDSAERGAYRRNRG